MEGLEASEVLLSYALLNNDIFRFDSNYFQKQYLLGEKTIRGKSSKTLSELGVKLRSFGAYSLNNEVEYLESGVPFIRGINMKNGRVSFTDMLYISEEAHALLWKSEVKPETILLSMSGTIGEVAIASTNWSYPINSNQDIAKLETNGNINPYFLYAFFLTKYGQNSLQREARGSVQQHVFLSQIEQFDIPIFSGSFQTIIQQVVITSETALTNANRCYTKAETLLLDALSLTGFTPSSANTNTKSFQESFLSSGRLDAEHYQPKFDEIEALIRCNGEYFRRIEEIQTYNTRGLQPEYAEQGSLDVINSKHILEDHLDYDNFEKTSAEYWDLQEKAQVFKEDILVYTTGANIGRTNIYQSDKKALASNHVNILRIKEEDPYYVAFVMNSFIGRMQTDKLSTGSAQAELYPKDIAQFIIPFVAKEVQQQIREKVIASLTLKKQSTALLDVAKRAVEIAIEQDEAAALSFIADMQML